MKNLICILSVCIVISAAVACKSGKQAKNYNHLIDDGSITFVQQSLENGQTELQASKLAQTLSKNPRVLGFANKVILDQSVIGNELIQIATVNKISGIDSISAEHKGVIDNIKTLRDTTFDKAYIQFMVGNRLRAVKTFTTAATDKTEELQQFARKALPVLVAHLDSANAIYADLK